MTDPREGKPSASMFHRIVFCPGSRTAEEDQPEEETQEWTEDGSAIAKARETGITKHLTEDQREVYDQLVEQEGRLVGDWLSQLGLTLFTPEVVRERRYWIHDDETGLEHQVSAQVDAVHLVPPYALVIDDKSGWLPVTPAERNWQLKVQAVALKEAHPELIHVRVAISQFRLGGRIDPCDYNTEALSFARREVLYHNEQSKDPMAYRNPGPWCDHCRAKAGCPAAQSFASLTQYALPVPAEGKPDPKAMVARLSDEQVSRIVESKTLIEKILGAAKSRLEALPETRLNELGWILKPGAQVQQVKDHEGAAAVLFEDPDEYDKFTKTEVSIPAIAKALHPRWKAEQKAAGIKKGLSLKDFEKQVKERLLPYSDVEQNKASLERVKE